MRNFIVLLLAIICVFNIDAQDTLKFKVMTFNLRFGERASLEEIADYIKANNPDFVALQEVDVNTLRKQASFQNGKNFISVLADRTNMFGIYGKTIDFSGGYYGIGILSKFPYFNIEKINLPNPKVEEPRVLLIGNFEVSKSDTVTFAATHLDHKDEDTRVVQSNFISNYLKKSHYPIILGGDFNANADSKPVLEILNSNWLNATDKSFTFPSWNPSVKIDYIFSYPKDRWKFLKTNVPNNLLSDHLSVISEIEYVK